VQLAAWAGVRVVAASSSNLRNGEFLRGLGASEVVEYGDLEGEEGGFDVIVDCVGGGVLSKCWRYVKGGGVLISVDSASFDFVAEHKKRGLCNGKEDVKALFFIVEGSGDALSDLAALAGSGALRSFVAATFPFKSTMEAYDFANGRFEGRGKVVLTV
jgi:NADPH2:quinone reductase